MAHKTTVKIHSNNEWLRFNLPEPPARRFLATEVITMGTTGTSYHKKRICRSAARFRVTNLIDPSRVAAPIEVGSDPGVENPIDWAFTQHIA